MGMLDGMRVAVLATDGAEESEVEAPAEALRAAGAKVQIVALHGGRIQAYRGDEVGGTFDVSIAVSIARPENYQALLIPGGLRSAQALGPRREVAAFIQAMAQQGSPVAAIGDGVGLLATAGLADGMTLTSARELRGELEQAGASWVDRDVVNDGSLVTSRTPADLPAFCREVRALFESAWAPAVTAPPHR
jgi:protease I